MLHSCRLSINYSLREPSQWKILPNVKNRVQGDISNDGNIILPLSNALERGPGGEVVLLAQRLKLKAQCQKPELR